MLFHVPGPERVLEEALRVTRPNGLLAVFDGDYSTTTVATRANDPLPACAEAAVEALVTDRVLVRRLRPLVSATGWDEIRVRSHGYLETDEPGYMLTIVERGPNAVVAAGGLGESALKTEARRRGERGESFGHIAYASLIAKRL